MDYSATRASDDERDAAIDLLRGHMLAGRITSAELDERIAEACDAKTYGDLDLALRGLPQRPVPDAPLHPGAFVKPRPTNGTATTSLVLSITSLVLYVYSVGLLSIICLPMWATAWFLGRNARRAIARTGEGGASQARAGEILGIMGTVLAASGLAGCAALLSSAL